MCGIVRALVKLKFRVRKVLLGISNWCLLLFDLAQSADALIVVHHLILCLLSRLLLRPGGRLLMSIVGETRR